MRIKNYTKFNDQLLREIIAFTKPSGVSGFDISFKNSEAGWKGRAYTQGCSFHNRSLRSRGEKTAPTYIVIGVPHNTTEAKRYKRPNVTDFGKGYLRSVQLSPVEDMVHLVAHELRHLWQGVIKKGWRVWGARGQFSERDADAYAIRMVRKWRRERGFVVAVKAPTAVVEAPKPAAPVVVQPKAARPSIVDQRAKKAQDDLDRWTRKLKLAQTKVRKLKIRVRYYTQKKVAAPDSL
jgi:hypothetical protein